MAVRFTKAQRFAFSFQLRLSSNKVEDEIQQAVKILRAFVKTLKNKRLNP
jgi:hypothetical protein